MPQPEGRTTILGTKLPDGRISPGLAFDKWHLYDTFVPDHYLNYRQQRKELVPFEQTETRHRYLTRVAREVQATGRDHYRTWYSGFDRACRALDCDGPRKSVRTEWRMVVGWATNPALEAGLTLHPLYGFPYIPGSAVKGVMHRVVEDTLLPLVPKPTTPGDAPEPVPPELTAALTWAARIRVLFGSLHLKAADPRQPQSALERLEQWRSKARRAVAGEAPAAEWKELLPTLERVCSPAATGGMVTCFDAVPAEAAFEVDREQEDDRDLLTVDVLTPHTAGKPIPITFLAVRDGVIFELRFLLAGWPQDPPRDEAEAERAEALAGVDRETIETKLDRWLVQGLYELGAGGKTTAGYGHLVIGRPPAPPAALVPKKVTGVEPPKRKVPPEIAMARKLLPDDIGLDPAITLLDKELARPSSDNLIAVIHRFRELFPTAESAWEGAKKQSKIQRLQRIQEALAEDTKS